MKVWKALFLLMILGFCPLFITGCDGDEEIEMPSEVIELDEPYTYGTANLRISHIIFLGIGSIETETVVPLKFPAKQGDTFVLKGEVKATKKTESEWNLAGAGDVQGLSSTIMVPVTYEVTGYFDYVGCGFKFDLAETVHYSEVKTFENLALGELAIDLGADEKSYFVDQLLTSSTPEITVDDSLIVSQLEELHLRISDVSLPADMTCDFH